MLKQHQFLALAVGATLLISVGCSDSLVGPSQSPGEEVDGLPILSHGSDPALSAEGDSILGSDAPPRVVTVDIHEGDVAPGCPAFGTDDGLAPPRETTAEPEA